jgi:hypothetical protein
MSSTHDESVTSDLTPSKSQITPSTTVAISTVNVVGDPINQVSSLISSSLCHFSLSFL